MSVLKHTTNFNLTYSDGATIPTHLKHNADNMKIIDAELKHIEDEMAEYVGEQAQIDALREDLTTLENSVDEYETATDARIDAVESDVAALKPENIKNIETRLTSVENKAQATADALHALTDRVADDETTIANHGVLIDGLRSDLDECCDEVKTHLTTIDNEIDALEAQDVEIIAKVDDLDNTVEALDAHVTTLANDVNSVLLDIQTNAANIATNASHIDNLEHRVDDLEDRANGYDAQFSSISEYARTTLQTISRMQEEIDELEPQGIEALTARVGTLETQYASLNSETRSILATVQQNTTDIDNLEQDFGQIDSRINSVSSVANATAANLSTLTGQFNALKTAFDTLSAQVINRDIV